MKTFATIAGVATALSASTSALAAVTVIGTSPARICYEAARAEARGVHELPTCDLALAGGGALDSRDTVATHVNRGILRMHRGDVRGAVADYDNAIALDPNQPEAWLNKGLAMMRNGAPASETLPMFDTAVAKGTRMPALAHFARAVVHEEAGNYRAAYSDLLRARALSPKWAAPARELKRYQLRRTSGGSSAASR